jgi:uncharacterized protein (TIGR02996 family)
MNTTDERTVLHRAILTDPTDDTARLVYADHLDDYPASAADVARARFIRHQIAEAYHNVNVFAPRFATC